jgi:16S rRNA (cytidine1402-2'-O)-methyltransferase
LSSAALVVAEDTRHSRRLLDHYQITTRTAAYHEHNEAREAPKLVKRLLDGDTIALIADAGTPLLSGSRRAPRRRRNRCWNPVIPIPGASALLAALVGSGLAGDQFTFFGFLPRKGKERLHVLTEIMRMQHTAIIYEAPSRVGATLTELSEAGAGSTHRRRCARADEEVRGIRTRHSHDLAKRFSESPARGEVVILISGAEAIEVSEEFLSDEAQRMRNEGATQRQIVEWLISRHGAPRNLAYKLAHQP